MSTTLKAIEAIVDPDGRFETLEPLPFKRRTKVILTVAVEEERGENADLAAASEATWGADWNNSEEDQAWADL